MLFIFAQIKHTESGISLNLHEWVFFFLSKCNSWTRSVTDSLPTNTSPESQKRHGLLFCVFASSLILTLSLVAVPFLTSLSQSPFLAQWVSSSKQLHLRQNRGIWNIHTYIAQNDGWQQPSMGLRVFFLPLCMYFSFVLELFIVFLFTSAPMQTTCKSFHRVSLLLFLFFLCSGTSSHLPLN